MKVNKSEKKKIQTINRLSFPQPKKAKCFKKDCKKLIKVKYVVPNKSYSKINNWEYGTNPEAKNPNFGRDKEARKDDRYICNSCLLSFVL